jgi:DNA-binding transcriptional MerR regulator
MGSYTMSQVETLTGIKSHTLRVWERRYSFLKPSRTASNIRFYSDEEVRKLLNISILLNNNYRISKIDNLNVDEFNELILNLKFNYSDKFEDDINRLILYMIDMDENAFEQVFQKNVMKNGLLTTMISLIYPFLNQVGLLWTTNKTIPSQEHFMSNLIRQKIISAIDLLNNPDDSAPRIILLLPEEESHEIGLILASYIAKKSGWRVYYLGQNVPIVNLDKLQELTKAKAFFTMFVAPKKEKYFANFTSKAHKIDAAFFVSGNYDAKYVSSNIKYISNPDDFTEQLKKLSLKAVV